MRLNFKNMKRMKIALILLIIFFVLNGITTQAVNTDGPGIAGEIDSDVFLRSIPRHMTIGESYSVSVFVKNSGNAHASFMVILFAPGEYIYPQQSYKLVTLGRGEERRIIFPITPAKPNLGELKIIAKLFFVSYEAENQEGKMHELDSVSSSVFNIKRAYSISIRHIAALMIGVIIVISAIAITVLKKRK
jgi:hypothetical protein